MAEPRTPAPRRRTRWARRRTCCAAASGATCRLACASGGGSDTKVTRLRELRGARDRLERSQAWPSHVSNILDASREDAPLPPRGRERRRSAEGIVRVLRPTSSGSPRPSSRMATRLDHRPGAASRQKQPGPVAVSQRSPARDAAFQRKRAGRSADARRRSAPRRERESSRQSRRARRRGAPLAALITDVLAETSTGAVAFSCSRFRGNAGQGTSRIAASSERSSTAPASAVSRALTSDSRRGRTRTRAAACMLPRLARHLGELLRPTVMPHHRLDVVCRRVLAAASSSAFSAREPGERDEQ